jgi:hypothetical protein
MLPVKVIGVTPDGEEYVIGTFNQGVVISDDRVIDMASSQWIAKKQQSIWIGRPVMGKALVFTMVFVQTTS